MLNYLLLAASLFSAAVVHADQQADPQPLRATVPQRMNLVYDLYRNGQKLGQVTDSFSRTGSQYKLVSETRASGPLKFLWPGSIRLESVGTVTAQGLQPSQFQHARSDAPHKLAIARLDWDKHSIAYRYKGESWQVTDLKSGAQDQLSQLYQFMFAPSLPADYGLQVVSGRKLNDYRYARSDGATIETPLGKFATQQYRRLIQQADEKAITVWVAPSRGNLPVRVRVVEDGVTLEQRLVRASVEG